MIVTLEMTVCRHNDFHSKMKKFFLAPTPTVQDLIFRTMNASDPMNVDRWGQFSGNVSDSHIHGPHPYVDSSSGRKVS